MLNLEMDWIPEQMALLHFPCHLVWVTIARNGEDVFTPSDSILVNEGQRLLAASLSCPLFKHTSYHTEHEKTQCRVSDPPHTEASHSVTEGRVGWREASRGPRGQDSSVLKSWPRAHKALGLVLVPHKFSQGPRTQQG